MKYINEKFGLDYLIDPIEIGLHDVSADGAFACPICNHLISSEFELSDEELSYCEHVGLVLMYDFDEPVFVSDDWELIADGVRNILLQFRMDVRDFIHDNLSTLSVGSKSYMKLHKWSGVGGSFEQLMLTMLSLRKGTSIVRIDDSLNHYFTSMTFVFSTELNVSALN